jgi:hypothetical protein
MVIDIIVSDLNADGLGENTGHQHKAAFVEIRACSRPIDFGFVIRR